MLLIFCTFGYPPFQRFLLRRRKHLVRFCGRHDIVAVVENSADNFALFRVAWNNYGSVGFAWRESVLGAIQTQLPLAGGGIRAVAGKAILRQDRPDIPVVFERSGRLGRRDLSGHRANRGQ